MHYLISILRVLCKWSFLKTDFNPYVCWNLKKKEINLFGSFLKYSSEVFLKYFLNTSLKYSSALLEATKYKLN